MRECDLPEFESSLESNSNYTVISLEDLDKIMELGVLIVPDRSDKGIAFTYDPQDKNYSWLKSRRYEMRFEFTEYDEKKPFVGYPPKPFGRGKTWALIVLDRTSIGTLSFGILDENDPMPQEASKFDPKTGVQPYKRYDIPLLYFNPREKYPPPVHQQRPPA